MSGTSAWPASHLAKPEVCHLQFQKKKSECDAKRCSQAHLGIILFTSSAPAGHRFTICAVSNASTLALFARSRDVREGNHEHIPRASTATVAEGNDLALEQPMPGQWY